MARRSFYTKAAWRRRILYSAHLTDSAYLFSRGLFNAKWSAAGFLPC
jgi:hypothetical protein